MKNVTDKEILKGNKLIAEFMDILYGPHKNKVRYNYLDVVGAHINNGLKFHSSWDWLMPVVDKIEHLDETDISLGFVDINSHYVRIHSLCKNQPVIIIGCYKESPEKNNCNLKIEATYKAVIEFIKWYNKQKETK